MPLRFLLYLSDVLKKFIRHEDLFGRRKLLLPAPQFVVFYNGTEERPDVEDFCLSGSFIKEPKKNSVELVCTVYNINKGKNDELLDNCRVLKGYMTFNDKTRTKIEHNMGQGYTQKEAIEKAIDEAIRECIDEDVLKDFFIRRGNEVREVAALDYTWERREKLIARDNKEDGRHEGILLNRITSVKNLMETMNLSMEQAMDALKIPESEREEIRVSVSKTEI